MEKQASVHEKAVAYGIDVSLIRSNLRRTPAQRLRQHDQTLTMIEKLHKAMDRKHG